MNAIEAAQMLSLRQVSGPTTDFFAGWNPEKTNPVAIQIRFGAPIL